MRAMLMSPLQHLVWRLEPHLLHLVVRAPHLTQMITWKTVLVVAICQSHTSAETVSLKSSSMNCTPGGHESKRRCSMLPRQRRLLLLPSQHPHLLGMSQGAKDG